MASTVAPSEVELDNDDAVALLTHVFSNGARRATLVDARIRYMQRADFPSHARTGRGRRTTHDLRAILKIAVALTLIDFGVPAAKAAEAVAGEWKMIGFALADAWFAARESGTPKAERMPVLAVSPWVLCEGDDKIRLGRLTRKMLSDPRPASSDAIYGRLMIDCVSVVDAIASGLADVSRYRDDEIEAAFSAFARHPLD
ncbi:hypothetical protein [Sphingomonas corticis]|uniref:Uncharacterized protein n=1 Tax=Sphingomonas corticis TaxID=2722791 RepID=A0ABX1CTU3_9SPHN|nr:hypothetical protein [Sphingomonas corticis]NJR80058.1 hypothetical protein [Sphingomonas corticis]